MELHKARGLCGGPFQPGSRFLLLSKDTAGYFVNASAVSKDAAAPCFDGDERIRSCPVATAGSRPVQWAFELHTAAEKGVLPALVGSPANLTALAYDAMRAVETALLERQRYEMDRLKAGR